MRPQTIREEIAKALELFANGTTVRDIGKIIGRTEPAVSKLITKYWLPLKSSYNTITFVMDSKTNYNMKQKFYIVEQKNGLYSIYHNSLNSGNPVETELCIKLDIPELDEAIDIVENTLEGDHTLIAYTHE